MASSSKLTDEDAASFLHRFDKAFLDLFYTPRTIYNYRSQVKSRAINRDSFEQDVIKLCTVI